MLLSDSLDDCTGHSHQPVGRDVQGPYEAFTCATCSCSGISDETSIQHHFSHGCTGLKSRCHGRRQCCSCIPS